MRILKALILTYKDNGNERTVFALSENEFAKEARKYADKEGFEPVCTEVIYIAGGKAVEAEEKEISKIYLLGYRDGDGKLQAVFALSEEEYGKQARAYAAAGNQLVSSGKIYRM